MFYLLIGIVIAVSFNDRFRERLAQNCRTGRTIFVTDAHRDDGKRFVVHADEMLTAFVELESAVHEGQRLAPAIG